MADNGKLKLQPVDVYGKRLQENVDVFLRHTRRAQSLVFKGHDASKTISGLFTSVEGPYQISVDPPSYHRVSFFQNIKTSGVTEVPITFPVDASKVVGVNFPKHAGLSKELRTLLSNSANVFGFEHKSGSDLYDALGVDSIKLAGLLNIACKTLATVFADGANVLSLVKELRIVRGDRFFAFVERGLREQTIDSVNSGLFHKVSGSLHKLPPEFEDFKPTDPNPKADNPAFEPADSFKTNDHFGNLQLTFFRKGDQFVADIDIDDAAGIEHIFQVLHNHFTGEPTHPYNIHEILVAHQQLDPKYTFNL